MEVSRRGEFVFGNQELFGDGIGQDELAFEGLGFPGLGHFFIDMLCMYVFIETPEAVI